MKFKLEMSAGIEGVRDYFDIAQALIGMARKMEMQHNADVEIKELAIGAVRDSNGNTVGHWEVVK